MAYVDIITGNDAVGWFQPGLQKRLPKAVKSKGAVSPATRARAKRMAVIMPRYAAGTTTLAMVRHLLAPRAMEPSRRARGTECRNSSVLRKVIGIIIKPRANAPARVE